MSAYRHTFRLECDSSKVGKVVDQITGAAMALIRGETSEIQIALLMAGVLVAKPNITSITAKLVDSTGAVLAEWTNSGADLSNSLTVGSWRRGVGYLTAFVLTAADSTALAADRYRLLISGLLNSVPSGSTGTVIFANADFDLTDNPEGELASTPPAPGPPTSYTKAEDDARFAPLGDSATLATLATEVDDIEAWLDYAPGSPIKFVSAGAVQSFNVAQQLQARQNINAEICAATGTATLAGGATRIPTPASQRRSVLTLTGNVTFANAATFADWIPGQIYEFLFIQDATGGRTVTWGNSYIFPTFAVVDPQPSAVTRLFGRSDGANVRIVEAEPLSSPRPDYLISAAVGLSHNSTPNVTSWSERANGYIMTLGGTFQYSDIAGRPAVVLAGGNQMSFLTPRKAFPVCGVTVAVVFLSSGGSSPQVLVHSPGLGVEVVYTTAAGLYISALGASLANRVKLPFTLAENYTKIFIGTIRSNSLGGGMAIDQNGATTFNPLGSMSTPAIGGSEYFGSGGSVEYWTGGLNQVLMFDRALRWSEMIALRRQLQYEIGLVT